MTTIAEIQRAVLALPEADYARLCKWINELDWERWDRQIEADSASGALDFLAEEAFASTEHRPLPTDH